MYFETKDLSPKSASMPRPVHHRVSLRKLRQLLRNSPDVQVLCGAGISMIAPTNLPSGNELRDICVRQLLTDEISRPYLDKLLTTKTYGGVIAGSYAPGSGFDAGNTIGPVVGTRLRQALPNPAHQYLALNYSQLFTTNFDLCFEDAGAKAVAHLHGTISDPGSLQNQMYRLGKTALCEMDQFRIAIENRSLLILGYSLRDSDVVEAIADVPDLGQTLRVNARLISTETGEIISVASVTIFKDQSVISLMQQATTSTDKAGISNRPSTINSPWPETSNIPQKVDVDFFTFELKRCRKSNTSVLCEFVITNNDQVRQIYLFNPTLYDEFGNEAQSRRPEIANSSNYTLMISGVPVAVRVTFDGISPQATKISLLTLRGDVNRTRFEVPFRNIPLTN